MDFLYWLASVRSGPLDWVFRFFTFFGEELVVTVVLCALLWCVDKRIAYRIGVAFFASGMAVQTLKITFRTERPWVLDPAFTPVKGALETATGYSFPSGHTQSAAALYGTLGLSVRQKWAKCVLFCLIPLVALSRMYLGVHTPADVVVSILITAFITVLIYFLLKKYDSKIVLPVLLLILSIASAVYAFCVLFSGLVPYSEASDCFKGAGAGTGFAIGYFIERRYINYNEKAGSLFVKILKLAIGLAVTVALKEGLKMLLGAGPAADMTRYTIIIVWVTAIYPAILSKTKRKEISE